MEHYWKISFLFIIFIMLAVYLDRIYKKPDLYSKINFVDHIVWINLDRSHKRKKEMLKKLEPINIPNTRIKAVDGKNQEMIKKFKKGLVYSISDIEFACLLSHIKAISFCENLPGEHFLIVEDDVSFKKNLAFFRISLKDIIKNAPPFEILMIYKNLLRPLPYLYTDWNQEYEKGWHISGCVAYVITKKGVKTILRNVFYEKQKDTFHFYNKNINLADLFLFQNSHTIIYRYNFFSVEVKESTIHTEHLPIQTQCVNFQDQEIKKNLVNLKI